MRPRDGSTIIRRTLRRHRRRLAAGTVLVSLHQVAETLVPVAIGVIIDRAIARGSWPELVVSLALLGVLFLCLSTSWRFGARILVHAIQHEEHALRVEVAGRVLHPQSVRTDLRAGELLTVSTSDAENAANILDAVPRTIAALTATVVTTVALLVIDIPLGLAVLLGTPVILGLLQLTAPRLVRRANAQQEHAARASGVATDLISGLRPLRGIGAEDAAATRFTEVSQQALRARLLAAKADAAFNAAGVTVTALLAAAVAGMAGWFALDGRITVGELITVVGLAQFLIEPLGTLSGVPGELARARGSAQRLALVLSAEPLLPPGSTPLAGRTGLQVRGLAHRSLNGVSFDAAPGEMLGVFAHQQQDAEALAAVLSGQVAPEEYTGQVLLGGTPLPEITIGDARSALLAEPHHTDLFAGTLGSNVALSGPHPGVGAALTAAAADEVVAGFPDGLAHPVSDRGSTLSGGQRQRVALARALAAQPPMLLLHEPTTAVDAVTEHAIAAGIRQLRHQGSDPDPLPTTVVITSSPALLAATDRVLVMRDGTITAAGTHAELCGSDNDYMLAVLR